MKHLSGMDSTFLHVETAEMPMHVGSLNVLDLPEGYQGDFYEDAKAFMAGRLHLADVFTRKLALMPFDLSNPVWVEDDDVDLDYHVRLVTLPRPGTNRQLQQYVARLHSSLLDRSRPLWEMFIIEGLRSGQVGLYVKVHHAGIDGQAGVALGRALFDTSPTGRAIRPPRPRTRSNNYQLGMAELAGAALRNTAQQYVKLLKMAPALARAIAGLAQPVENAEARTVGDLPKKFDLTAPRTPLNVSITNQRSWAGRTIPLAETKHIARHFGASVNDVAMATVSGALRQYLADSNELPAKSLVAGVPVSLREAGDETANNQVSMILVSLATDVSDPVERLRQITASSGSAKSIMGRFKAAIPDDYPMFAAPWLMSGLASMLGRSRLADLVPPAANLVISNVPSSPVPIYFAGALATCYYPVSIPGHGMALNITVHSYNGRMDYGLIACRRALPDLNELGDYMLAEHRRLMELTEKVPATPAPGKKIEAVKDAAPAASSLATAHAGAAAPADAPSQGGTARRGAAKKAATRKSASSGSAAAAKPAERAPRSDAATEATPEDAAGRRKAAPRKVAAKKAAATARKSAAGTTGAARKSAAGKASGRVARKAAATDGTADATAGKTVAKKAASRKTASRKTAAGSPATQDADTATSDGAAGGRPAAAASARPSADSAAPAPAASPAAAPVSEAAAARSDADSPAT